MFWLSAIDRETGEECSYLLLGTSLHSFNPKPHKAARVPTLRSQEIFLHNVSTRASAPVKLILLHKGLEAHELWE